MTPTRVAVVGGHGKTGHAVTAALHHRGAAVTPLGRAELNDPVEALRGCDAAYLIAPNMHPDEPALIADLLEAALAAGVPKIVYHSVAMPYAPTMPHHLGKARSEDLIRHLPVPWVILQPGPYVQNFVPALKLPDPTLDQPYDTAKPFNFVDLADVAEAAAQVLLDGHHDGATYELAGPDRMSVAALAAVAADILGTQITSSRIDPDAWATGPGAALEPRERDWLLAMFDYYDRYGLLGGPLTLQAVLGRPSTGLRSVLERELLAP